MTDTTSVFDGVKAVEDHPGIYLRKDGYYCFLDSTESLNGAYHTVEGAEKAREDDRNLLQ